MTPRTALPPCICGFHLRHDCPRHGVKGTKAPSTRPAKRKPLKAASDTRAVEKREWALIKRTLIVAQKRYRRGTFCEACKASTPASKLDCDHIIPSGDGGPWKPGNAQLLCRPCHEAKHGNQPKWSR